MIFQLISIGLIIIGCYNNIRLDSKKPTQVPKFWFEVVFLSIIGIIVIFTLSSVIGGWTLNLLDISDLVKSKWVTYTITLVISIMYCAGVSIYHGDDDQTGNY
jgi:hypothetical protein